MISSEAGERLARAKARLDKERKQPTELYHFACNQFREAAYAVADELVAQGFGNAEGD